MSSTNSLHKILKDKDYFCKKQTNPQYYYYTNNNSWIPSNTQSGSNSTAKLYRLGSSTGKNGSSNEEQDNMVTYAFVLKLCQRLGQSMV